MGSPFGYDCDGAYSLGRFGAVPGFGGSCLGRGIAALLKKQSSAHSYSCNHQKYQNQDVLVQNDSFCDLILSTSVMDNVALACPRIMCHMLSWR